MKRHWQMFIVVALALCVALTCATHARARVSEDDAAAELALQEGPGALEQDAEPADEGVDDPLAGEDAPAQQPAEQPDPVVAKEQAATEGDAAAEPAPGQDPEPAAPQPEDAPLSLEAATIVPLPDQTYTGRDLTPAVQVLLGDDELLEGRDFSVTYHDNRNAGTAGVTVVGMGSYEGSCEASFAIKPRSLAKAQVAKVANQVYAAADLKPSPKVTLGKETLKKGADYTLSYKNNRKVGTATITVKGTGNYSGTKSASFKIGKVKLSKASVAKLGTQDYTGKAVRPKPKITLGKVTLKEGTDYSLAYKNNTKVGTATLTITGKGGVTGSQKVTFKIAKPSIAKATVAKVKDQTYTGKNITPKPKVTRGKATLKLGRDYTLSYKNNKKVGTATIILKGKGTYTGTKSVTFKIVKKKGGSSGKRAAAVGPSTAGALSVKGSQLCDKNGKAIQLRGVSTHGLAWFPGYVNDACFKQLRTEWGANVVRLALYSAENGGYCAGGSQKDLKALVKKGVNAATANDLYVIVDWHILSDGNPLSHKKEAKAFFKEMSAAFKGNNNVIYEICNEPNGGTSWADIKKYANEVIPVIRANDPDAIVLVGTPTWSQEVDKAAASPLTFDNVLYTLHFYAATHKDDLRNRLATAVKGGLPVFVSEFGICDASGNGALDESSANSWMSTMDSLGVSWCMWSLCNKAESASVIKSSCTATSGFKAGDLTASGTWLLKALGGTLPAGTVAQGGEAPNGSSGGSANDGAAAKLAQPATFTSGGLTCTATMVNQWDAGGGKTCYQYELSIKNTGKACTSWKVTVPFNRAVSLANGWNGTYAAKGSQLSITSMDHNGAIAKGGTVTGIGFQVTAAAGLDIKAGS